MTVSSLKLLQYDCKELFVSMEQEQGCRFMCMAPFNSKDIQSTLHMAYKTLRQGMKEKKGKITAHGNMILKNNIKQDKLS